MHINSLERVQRHFTKRITELHGLSYQERLTGFRLETLECRRLSCDLTMYYTVFHNLTPWVPSDYFNIVIPPHNLHSVHHDFNIRKPRCRTNIFANDFLTVASLHGLICLVLSLFQSLLLRLSVFLYLLICPNF